MGACMRLPWGLGLAWGACLHFTADGMISPSGDCRSPGVVSAFDGYLALVVAEGRCDSRDCAENSQHVL